MLYKKKNLWNTPKRINYNQFNYLIVGIGLNTNNTPINKKFSSTCLKNIVNKKINNKKFLKKIRIRYEKFLTETEKLSFKTQRKI